MYHDIADDGAFLQQIRHVNYRTKQPLHVELGFCQLTLSTTLLSLFWATRFGDGDVATNRDWSPEKSGTGHSGTVRREIQDLAT
ncbi:hypothetical protein E4U36_004559 [Claviceps purpurea]|nr:hypothetical protein E4U36_004559 [Claviceps purpurea]